MGEADKQRARAAKAAKRLEKERLRLAAKRAAQRAARGKPPEVVVPPKGTKNVRTGQPDTTGRVGPCNKAISAQKSWSASIYTRWRNHAV